MLKRMMKRLETMSRQSAESQAGFSLIEMLIVIALMALVGTFVATNVIHKLEMAKVDAAKIQMKQLGVILDDFRRVCNFYPTTDQGLEALVKAPSGRECKNYDPEGFIKDKKVPKDPWDHDYGYESDGNKYKITSYGADGKAGGDGVDKDITSDDVS